MTEEISYSFPDIDWESVGAHVAILNDVEPEALRADGFDEAIVGVVQCFNKQLLCYSTAKILTIMMERDGMSELEALEYFNFNIVGAYVGAYTPVFLQDY